MTLRRFRMPACRVSAAMRALDARSAGRTRRRFRTSLRGTDPATPGRFPRFAAALEPAALLDVARHAPAACDLWMPAPAPEPVAAFVQASAAPTPAYSWSTQRVAAALEPVQSWMWHGTHPQRATLDARSGTRTGRRFRTSFRGTDSRFTPGRFRASPPHWSLPQSWMRRGTLRQPATSGCPLRHPNPSPLLYKLPRRFHPRVPCACRSSPSNRRPHLPRTRCSTRPRCANAGCPARHPNRPPPSCRPLRG